MAAMRRSFSTTAYLVLSAVALGLLAVNVLAWSGRLVEDSELESSTPAQEEPAPRSAPPPSRSEPRSVTRPQSQRSQPTAVTAMTITATRGDCWVEVRAGSASGNVLYAGTLEGGSTLRFNRPRLWLRLGAASNVDVVVNGRAAEVPSGTVELLLPT
jgi:hypothetical protein